VEPVTGTPAGEKPSEAKSEIKPIEQPPEPEYDFLDPAKLRLVRAPSGRTRATVDGDRSFLDVKIVRCFPQTIPDEFWAVAHQDNRIIGVIEDPRALDDDSRGVAVRGLEQEYFMPVITSIRSLKEEFGAVYFEVETDRGPRTFVSKAVRDSVDETDKGEVILVDVDENRYCIPDWQRLDARSVRYLERII